MGESAIGGLILLCFFRRFRAFGVLGLGVSGLGFVLCFGVCALFTLQRFAGFGSVLDVAWGGVVLQGLRAPLMGSRMVLLRGF